MDSTLPHLKDSRRTLIGPLMEARNHDTFSWGLHSRTRFSAKQVSLISRRIVSSLTLASSLQRQSQLLAKINQTSLSSSPDGPKGGFSRVQFRY
jgi:hypothetical protein